MYCIVEQIRDVLYTNQVNESSGLKHYTTQQTPFKGHHGNIINSSESCQPSNKAMHCYHGSHQTPSSTPILPYPTRSISTKPDLHEGSISATNPNGKTLAMIFAKRSTRTRVSAEAAWTYYVSSMVDCLFARVGGHEEIETLVQYSSVPVINALSAKFHPLQILADIAALYERYVPDALSKVSCSSGILPPLPPLKIAWVGDANNILNDLLLALPRLGTSITAACPSGYEVEPDVKFDAVSYSKEPGAGTVEFTSDPSVAVKDADVIVTDTWISMGQEAEKEARLTAFRGYQVTEAMARKSGANPDWTFLHCLPRKTHEVDDEVFYGPRSLVFPEAQFRKFTVMAVYEMIMLWHHEI
ncbi:ornithine carbamoyltransferase [Synchytrium endobioticum]|uniref:ornithine carbamoyltransferase n=1 Tax=Synchytrium endobioticum TaxID=286115 RepID=A0A507D4R8_9FUNG|nr:ornithine carbamoyltransferase [Synchytrium endobioticum]